VDLYKTDVYEIDGQMKYLKPQENGSRSDVRWAAVRNDDGVGFMIQADDHFMETSISQYEDDTMQNYRHMVEVPKAGYNVVNVDYMQRGVGGEACGPAPLSQYQIPNNANYVHSFRIVPFTSATNDELMAESKVQAESTNPVADIKVNGASVGNVNTANTFNVTVLQGTYKGTPKVEVVKNGSDTVVEFTQPETLPATVTIKATNGFGIEKILYIPIGEGL
jgi:beta-galactosidase